MNLVRDTLGFTCDRVYRWHLILEEYDPEIIYIKGSDNIAADAVSRIDYDASVNIRNINMHLHTFVLRCDTDSGGSLRFGHVANTQISVIS